jgi:hypothetical protein
MIPYTILVNNKPKNTVNTISKKNLSGSQLIMELPITPDVIKVIMQEINESQVSVYSSVYISSK